MRADELFGVILRVLGVWCLYQAGYVAVILILKIYNFQINSTVATAQDKLIIAYYLLAAFLLLVGTGKIVKLVYGRAA